MLLRALAPEGRGRVLLPAYVGQSPKEGSGIHDPIVAAGLDVSFYRLDASLRCLREDFERALASSEPVACLAVHYFGFPDPSLRWMGERCREAGVPLIEDCAHCTPVQSDGAGEGEVGQTGDFLLHSIHKILPTETGGVLTVRPGPFADLRASLEIEGPDSIALEDLQAFTSAEWAPLRHRRRENYRVLAGRLEGQAGVELLHPQLPRTVAPLNLPLLLSGEGLDRFAVYRALRERGVEAIALYHSLIEALAPGDFPQATETSARILNLPCHQDLGRDEMEAIAGLLPGALEDAATGVLP